MHRKKSNKENIIPSSPSLNLRRPLSNSLQQFSLKQSNKTPHKKLSSIINDDRYFPLMDLKNSPQESIAYKKSEEGPGILSTIEMLKRQA